LYPQEGKCHFSRKPAELLASLVFMLSAQKTVVPDARLWCLSGGQVELSTAGDHFRHAGMWSARVDTMPTSHVWSAGMLHMKSPF